ncbi:MAG TPA: MmcQ/YjbR family DNA-binding protein [Anaerolineae bacterium]|nr:MmcQ/YjbR family DNA-binding protein [Anaerolineae bacterium]HMR62686.1 MmcQ/YjbR family DNA-binding protein [Anaerolineae bacterium]
MNLEALRAYLLQKKATTEEQPFGPQALVFKVVGKMYALIAWEEQPLRLTLKCDPDLAVSLRHRYPAVQPGYYMNKAHWNTISLDGSILETELLGLIDHSYELVVASLKKADRIKLQESV